MSPARASFLLFWAAASIATVPACSGSAAPGQDVSLTVATRDSVFGEGGAGGRDLSLLGLAFGPLHGAVSQPGAACFWLGDDPSRVIVWPHGFSAKSNPLRLLDAKGRLVARVGDQVKLSGGQVPAGNLKVAGCSSFTTLWDTGAVVGVSHTSR